MEEWMPPNVMDGVSDLEMWIKPNIVEKSFHYLRINLLVHEEKCFPKGQVSFLGAGKNRDPLVLNINFFLFRPYLERLPTTEAISSESSSIQRKSLICPV